MNNERNFFILVAFIVFLIVAGLCYLGHHTHECKMKALEAGMKAEDISQVCGR